MKFGIWAALVDICSLKEFCHHCLYASKKWLITILLHLLIFKPFDELTCTHLAGVVVINY